MLMKYFFLYWKRCRFTIRADKITIKEPTQFILTSINIVNANHRTFYAYRAGKGPSGIALPEKTAPAKASKNLGCPKRKELPFASP